MKNLNPPAIVVSSQQQALALCQRANDYYSSELRHTTASLADAVHVGRVLLEAKPLVGHGGWIPFVQKNFRAPLRTAQVRMRLAENWHRLEEPIRLREEAGEPPLTVDGALQLLTEMDAPQVEPEAPALAQMDAEEAVEQTAAVPGSVPMPPLLPGKSYRGDTHTPLEMGKPVVRIVEIAPCEDDPRYWYYAVLHQTLVDGDQDADFTTDDYWDVNARGAPLNDPHWWPVLSRAFPGVSSWKEADSDLPPLCDHITPEGAKAIREDYRRRVWDLIEST